MKRLTRFAATAGALALVSASALAQGADDCTVAVDLGSATGSFPFDTTNCTDTGTNATTSAQTVCGLTEDVWFKWTVPAALDGHIVRFDDCGTANYDTELGLYLGGDCNTATNLACQDDGCTGLTSQIDWSVSTGEVYLIQVGYWSTSGGTYGQGTIQISDQGPDPCVAAVDDSFEENDDCNNAPTLGNSMNAGLYTQIGDEDFFTLNVADGDTVTIDALFSDATADLDIFLYQDAAACGIADPVNCTGSLACGFSASDNEQIMWTNSSGSAASYVLKVRIFAAGTGSCINYDLNIDGADGGIGTNYCTANANSAGTMALIRAEGSTVAADQNLTLITDGVRPGVPGLYFFGPTQIQVTFGDGFRCAGGQTTRIQPPENADAMGTTTRMLDFSAPYGANITSGADLNFQLWYRDPMAAMAGFNLSNGLNIMFQ